MHQRDVRQFVRPDRHRLLHQVHNLRVTQWQRAHLVDQRRIFIIRPAPTIVGVIHIFGAGCANRVDPLLVIALHPKPRLDHAATAIPLGGGRELTTAGLITENAPFQNAQDGINADIIQLLHDHARPRLHKGREDDVEREGSAVSPDILARTGIQCVAILLDQLA